MRTADLYREMAESLEADVAHGSAHFASVYVPDLNTVAAALREAAEMRELLGDFMDLRERSKITYMYLADEAEVVAVFRHARAILGGEPHD